jgi:hypothetical protein
MINRGVYDIPKDNYVNSKTINSHGDRNYNSFAPFLDYNIECYKCNNLGYKACDYRSLIEPPMEENNLLKHREIHPMIWKKKQEEQYKEECELDLHAQKKGSQCYIGSGCSKHINWNKKKILSLNKEKGSSDMFGDNASTKIVRKGIVSLGKKKTKA